MTSALIRPRGETSNPFFPAHSRIVCSCSADRPDPDALRAVEVVVRALHRMEVGADTDESRDRCDDPTTARPSIDGDRTRLRGPLDRTRPRAETVANHDARHSDRRNSPATLLGKMVSMSAHADLLLAVAIPAGGLIVFTLAFYLLGRRMRRLRRDGHLTYPAKTTPGSNDFSTNAM